MRQPANTSVQPGKPAKRRRLIFIIIMAIALVGFAVAYVRSEQRVNELESQSAQASQQEADALVRAVSKHFRLPDEKPTIATVEDVKKLEGQPFFKYAKKDDKVLMYTAAKKAILYRPSTDKIIEVAYLNIKK